MTISELVSHCIASNGGTFAVSAGSIRPTREDSQEGRPMGVQPWSYNARLANPTGTKGLPGHDSNGMDSLYNDPTFVRFAPLDWTSGYLVSIAPFWERPKDCKGAEWEFTVDGLTPLAVYSYVIHHVTQFDLGAYFGLWCDRRKWYLNCTVHVDHLGRALMLGRYYRQAAIWNCQWQEAIPVTESRSFHELSEAGQ